MSDYIPEDCWPEILKRLPVKSLARFRCVCRRWNTLICSSSFIADHHACSKAKPRLFIDYAYQRPSKQKSCVIYDSDSSAATFFPKITAQIPALKGVRSCRLVGSAKGILCFHIHHVYDERLGILLWNPVINKYTKLPGAHTRITSFWDRASIAIGVKPSEEDDLRVLAFRPEGNVTGAVAEIYSVRQGAWRSLQFNIPRCYISPYIEVIYNGYGDFHWVAEDDAYSHHLIRFGFEEEEFSCIALPDALVDCLHSTLYVAVYCGKLALLQRKYNDPRLKIWTRGDQYGNAADSWSVIICIDHVHHILGIAHDGQILMADKEDDLVLYNPTSRTRRQLEMKALELVYLCGGCPFVESLVFTDGEGGAVTPTPIGGASRGARGAAALRLRPKKKNKKKLVFPLVESSVFMDGDETRLRQSTAPLVRRSGRARRTPKYLEDYSR